MSKAVATILIVACSVLAIASGTLAFLLFRQPRFVPAKGENPYIMFDNKTSQACWAGARKPEIPVKDAVDQLFRDRQPPELPLCKDLE